MSRRCGRGQRYYSLVLRRVPPLRSFQTWDLLLRHRRRALVPQRQHRQVNRPCGRDRRCFSLVLRRVPSLPGCQTSALPRRLSSLPDCPTLALLPRPRLQVLGQHRQLRRVNRPWGRDRRCFNLVQPRRVLRADCPMLGLLRRRRRRALVLQRQHQQVNRPCGHDRRCRNRPHLRRLSSPASCPRRLLLVRRH